MLVAILGRCVLVLKEIPPRPPEYDGVLALHGLADAVDEEVRSDVRCKM